MRDEGGRKARRPVQEIVLTRTSPAHVRISGPLALAGLVFYCLSIIICENVSLQKQFCASPLQPRTERKKRNKLTFPALIERYSKSHFLVPACSQIKQERPWLQERRLYCNSATIFPKLVDFGLRCSDGPPPLCRSLCRGVFYATKPL